MNKSALYQTQKSLQGWQTIDPSILIVQRGARLAGKRSVLDIHEHCERARNEAGSNLQEQISTKERERLWLREAKCAAGLLRINQKAKGIASGFTMMELVVVIVILAILTAFATIKWPGSAISLNAQAAAVANDIRYTQSLAMTRGQRFRMVITSASTYQITDAAGNPVTLPSGSVTTTLDTGITFGTLTNLPNNLIAFDSKGVPYVDAVSPGTSLSSVAGPSSPVASIRLVTSEHTATISITPETGKVSL